LLLQQITIIRPLSAKLNVARLTFKVRHQILPSHNFALIYLSTFNSDKREPGPSCYKQLHTIFCAIIVSWAQKWKMEFNVATCKVMHTGNNNNEFSYEMNGKVLDKVLIEKDLV